MTSHHHGSHLFIRRSKSLGSTRTPGWGGGGRITQEHESLGARSGLPPLPLASHSPRWVLSMGYAPASSMSLDKPPPQTSFCFCFNSFLLLSISYIAFYLSLCLPFQKELISLKYLLCARKCCEGFVSLHSSNSDGQYELYSGVSYPYFCHQ